MLLAIHTFFATLGPQELSLRSAREDRPLRMVKTVLFEVRGLQAAKHIGVHQHTLLAALPCRCAR